MTLVAILLAVPVGFLVGRSKGVADIRTLGSGNIGVSNVLRVIGARAAAIVWVADCMKGLVPVLVGRHCFGLEGWPLALVAIAAVTGHCYSPYLRFSGGRGVSTDFGAMLGLYWPAGLCGGLLFAALVAKTRYVSLGSIIAVASAPLWALLWMLPVHGIAPVAWPYAGAAAITAAIIIYQHRPNIERLRAGTERKIGQKEPPPSQPAAQEAPAGE